MASQVAAPIGPLAGHISTAIRLARVICIVGVVYAHSWTGLDGAAQAAADGTPQGILRWGLVEIFGRSAVPLLGMIAGWLVVGSLARLSYGRFVAAKARAVLIPMIVWNAVAIALVCGAAALGWIAAPQISSLWWLIDELLCLATPNDVNVQTPFLRDLFVCMVLAPVLVRAPKPLLAALTAATLVWTLSGAEGILLLRPSILFFFSIGIVLRRLYAAAALGRLPMIVSVLPFAVLVGLRVWLEVHGAWSSPPLQLTATLDVVLRLAAAGAVWGVCWRLAKSPVAEALVQLEPFVFLVFCDHLILMWLGGPLVGRFTGPLGSPFYPPFLLLQPILVLALSVALGRSLSRLSPNLARLLSGGRLNEPPKVTAPANAIPAESYWTRSR